MWRTFARWRFGFTSSFCCSFSSNCLRAVIVGREATSYMPLGFAWTAFSLLALLVLVLGHEAAHVLVAKRLRARPVEVLIWPLGGLGHRALACRLAGAAHGRGGLGRPSTPSFFWCWLRSSTSMTRKSERGDSLGARRRRSLRGALFHGWQLGSHVALRRFNGSTSCCWF